MKKTYTSLAIVFLLLGIGVAIFEYLAGNDWQTSSILGVVFAVVLLLFIFPMHWIRSYYLGVRKNFSPYQEIILNKEVNLEKLDAAIQEKTNWKFQYKGEKLLHYRGRFTIWSWGEKIFVKLDDGKTIINSSPSLITTIVDYGQNYKNVKTILDLIPEEK